MSDNILDRVTIGAFAVAALSLFLLTVVSSFAFVTMFIPGLHVTVDDFLGNSWVCNSIWACSIGFLVSGLAMTTILMQPRAPTSQ